MPARTRSAIRLRSNSATAPSTMKTILPVGVLVSTCFERETKSPEMRRYTGCTEVSDSGTAQRYPATPVEK
jgi:hypothetical protein